MPGFLVEAAGGPGEYRKAGLFASGKTWTSKSASSGGTVSPQTDLKQPVGYRTHQIRVLFLDLTCRVPLGTQRALPAFVWLVPALDRKPLEVRNLMRSPRPPLHSAPGRVPDLHQEAPTSVSGPDCRYRPPPGGLAPRGARAGPGGRRGRAGRSRADRAAARVGAARGGGKRAGAGATRGRGPANERRAGGARGRPPGRARGWACPRVTRRAGAANRRARARAGLAAGAGGRSPEAGRTD
ncbi:uncharacterized protein LOC144321351 [Canis aureus]